MNGEEIVRKFVSMGRAIYMATLESALEAGEEECEIPDSMTVSATTNDNKIIEITIAIKEGDTNENL